MTALEKQNRAEAVRRALAHDEAERASGRPLDNLLGRLHQMALDVETGVISGRGDMLVRITWLLGKFDSDVDDEHRAEEMEREEREVMF